MAAILSAGMAVFLSTPSARRATSAAVDSYIAWQRFLSTPSARRATHVFGRVRPHHQNFYPRPPRGGRRSSSTGGTTSNEFLSTPSARRATPATCEERSYTIFLSTPSARRATIDLDDATITVRFLSTPSARRATHRAFQRLPRKAISIHALREEGDKADGDCLRSISISIHALREEGDRFACCGIILA